MVINKILSLVRFFYQHYGCARFYIKQIEPIHATNDFLLYFVDIQNDKLSTVNISYLFSDTDFLDNFSSQDASKIGHYAAKILVRNSQDAYAYKY